VVLLREGVQDALAAGVQGEELHLSGEVKQKVVVCLPGKEKGSRLCW